MTSSPPATGTSGGSASVGDQAAYFAFGFGGQLIEVLPEQDAVVVVSTEIDPAGPVTEGLQFDAVTNLVADVISPALD